MMAVGFVFGLALPAQDATTGAIEGRVKNAITGEYLRNATVAVKGTTRVELTDVAGYDLVGTILHAA